MPLQRIVSALLPLFPGRAGSPFFDEQSLAFHLGSQLDKCLGRLATEGSTNRVLHGRGRPHLLPVSRHQFRFTFGCAPASSADFDLRVCNRAPTALGVFVSYEHPGLGSTTGVSRGTGGQGKGCLFAGDPLGAGSRTDTLCRFHRSRSKRLRGLRGLRRPPFPCQLKSCAKDQRPALFLANSGPLTAPVDGSVSFTVPISRAERHRLPCSLAGMRRSPSE